MEPDDPEAPQIVAELHAPTPEETSAQAATEDTGAQPSGTDTEDDGAGEDWKYLEEAADAALDEEVGEDFEDDDIDGDSADEDAAGVDFDSISIRTGNIDGSDHTIVGKAVLDSISIETGNMGGSGNTLIGQINASLKGEPFLDELGVNTIRRLRDVFEQPQRFDTLVEESKARGTRIVVVYGSENSGKLTC